MKILAKIIKTSAAIAALSAIAAIITGIVFESVKLTSYFLGIFIALSLINLNIYIILGILGKENEVVIPAYVLNNFNDIYYIYVQNRIMAIEMQHTVENDPITGDLYDEWYQIDSTLICDYCIIPEADYILKEDTSFLTKVLAQV